MASRDAAPGKLTRQQLYERIRQSSKEEYILSEMIRLGYWDKHQEKPSLPTELIQKQGKLQRRLNELLKQQRLLDDPEKALKALHKARKKAALERREATKQQHNKARYQRALAWYEARQKDLVYLGEGVSAGLRNNDNQRSERLSAQGLPTFADAEALAAAMGVSINELRFLSYDRRTTRINHYQSFLIAKKSGGTRHISAPMPRLKRLQYWILGNILSAPVLHDAAHGFVPGRSIVSNAAPHVGKSVVINLDLQDFFPTIDYRRIKGLFAHLGYSEKIATVLALLCSEPLRDTLTLDGNTYHVGKSTRHLPQGAPTSPAISNLICRRLDKRLQGAAQALDFTYTRYADDLTFSYNGTADAPVTALLWRVKSIIADEGFIVHPEKTRIMRASRRQEVTGIVVNEKLAINKATLKRFRALLFQIEKDGPDGKSWGQGELFHSITGFANYVAMVNAEKGRHFQAQVQQLKTRYRPEAAAYPPPVALNKAAFKAKAMAGQAPTDSWWQAQAPEKPVKALTDAQIKQQKAAEKAAKSAATPPPYTPDTATSHDHPPTDSYASASLNAQLRKIGIYLFIIAAILLWLAFR